MLPSLPRGRTSRYWHMQGQEEQRPEPGSDSTYGIRSLGSVMDSEDGSEWDGPSGLESESRQEHVDFEDRAHEHGHDAEPEVKAEDASAAPSAISESEWTPTNDRSELPLPPTHDQGQGLADRNSQPQGSRRRPPSLSPLRTPDDLSEPSSPASFASFPSYMSSSLSRTSSLLDDQDQDQDGGSHQGPSQSVGLGMGMGGSEELVMPTMNIGHEHGHRPISARSRYRQSQLQISVPRPETAPVSLSDTRNGEIKVAIIGSSGMVDILINDLRAEDRVGDVKDLGRGMYTVLGLGKEEILATLITGLSPEEIENRVEEAYHTLNGALHPDPSPEVRDQVMDLTLGYAAKSDWVHLVLALDGEHDATSSLADLVPILFNSAPESTGKDISPSLQRSDPVEDFSSQPQSPEGAPDPTPMPGVEGHSYFPSLASSSTQSKTHSSLIRQLISALHDPDSIQRASSDKFLSWRSANRHLSQSSSHTSTHESSSIDSYEAEAAAMPTVARAQGGGEWEAGLSRRLAKRRQSDGLGQSRASAHHTRGTGKRRSTVTPNPKPRLHKENEKESCGPLFPSHSCPRSGNSYSRVGLGELVEKTFGGMRRRWRWGIVAAAVALVVGWNCNWGMWAGPQV